MKLSRSDWEYLALLSDSERRQLEKDVNSGMDGLRKQEQEKAKKGGKR